MIDIEKWKLRIENEIILQKELCLEEIKMTFTRRELIELKCLFDSMIEIEKQK